MIKKEILYRKKTIKMKKLLKMSEIYPNCPHNCPHSPH